MSEELVLTDVQRDALKEIGNICAGNAATVLSQLLNRKITIDVPRILIVPIEQVPNVVGGAETMVAGLVLRVFGDIPNTIVFIFSQRDAKVLSSFMTGKTMTESKVITDIERSALKEVGLILANAYLGALSSFVGLGMVPAAPELIMDMAGAIVDYILIELSCQSEYALLIESEFTEPSASVKGHFFIIPDPSGLEAMLKAIDKR